MKKIFLFLLVFSHILFSAQNIVYQESNKKKYIKLGKFKYIGKYEYSYEPESKESIYSFVLTKGNKKQYIGHFKYQLKSNTEIKINEKLPTIRQLENKIIEDFNYTSDEEKEQIIVTTYYYDEKEPKEKEVKILQQGKKGFFYVIQKQFFFRNGKTEEEKNLPEKIEFYKVPF